MDEAARAAAERTARRRAAKALAELAECAARLHDKLRSDQDIDSDSAGRLLHAHVSDATANLGVLEGVRTQ